VSASHQTGFFQAKSPFGVQMIQGSDLQSFILHVQVRGLAETTKGHGNKQFQKITPDLGFSTTHSQQRTSRYVSVDLTQYADQKTSKMWNYFLLGP
jgi:hypothetical protein